MYLGIDVGTRVIGYAIITCESIVSGSKSLEAKILGDQWDNFIGRLAVLSKWLPQLFDTPFTAVGIECPFCGPNYQTYLKLGIVFGYVAHEAQRRGIQVVRVAPTEAKKTLTGNGRATKDEMVQCARTFSGLDITSHDEADAIGVALFTKRKMDEQLYMV